MAARPPSASQQIDAHLAKLPEPQRSTLAALRRTLREVLPRGEEAMKYRMPSIVVQGKGVAAYDGFKQHCSYFPFSGSVVGQVPGIKPPLDPAQGTLRFPIDLPLSKALVKKLVRVRLDQISDVTNGKRFEFYDDGGVKAVGGMKAGQLHGAWMWYRRDGSLMRTGKFSNGDPTGVWETWDAGGGLVKRVTRG